MRQALEHRPVTRSLAAERAIGSVGTRHTVHQLRNQLSRSSRSSARSSSPLTRSLQSPINQPPRQGGQSNTLQTGQLMIMTRNQYLQHRRTMMNNAGAESGQNDIQASVNTSQRLAPGPSQPSVSPSISRGRKRSFEENDEPLTGSSRETGMEYELRVKIRRLETGRYFIICIFKVYSILVVPVNFGRASGLV